MSLLNYTTKIEADKTAAEITRMLQKAGASAVMTEYDTENSYITSISFQLNINEQKMGFRLPCDWKPILTIFENDPKVPNSKKNREQAVRTAWRIIKNWIQAQLAIIETRMVSTQQVFLPYAIMKDGRTLTEHVAEDPRLLLG